ncbi:MFS transporter [Paenibacillus sp. UNC451MF]|uniref:MFS transporter n=1 Tax=Paenibacillus sp. UNC451MF TaxID=1449063 RepID=UPI0005678A1C|nr:MFS transporter [Paenibacillus sp. UNC451MF]
MRAPHLSFRTGIVILKGCIELLLAFPLLLAAAVYILPESHRMLWIVFLPLGYAIGFILNSLMPLRQSYQQLLVSLCISVLYSYWMFGSTYAAMVPAIISFIVVYRGIRLVWIPWDVFFPVNFYVFGMILYFVASVVLHFVESFQPYMTLLTWGGLVALVITLLMSNESNMKQESLSGEKEPVIASEMMWKNRLLVILLLLVIVLVVSVRKLGEALIWLKNLLIYLLQALFSGSSPPPAKEPAKSPPPMPMNLSGNEEPAWWLVWLEKLLYYFVGALIVAAFLLAIYLIARRVPRLAKRLFAWLASKLYSEDKRIGKIGYEDDVESLMDWDTLNDKLFSKWKRLFSKNGPREKWEELHDNKQRIRFLYRSWLHQSMQRGYTFKSFLTPKETGSEIEQWEKKSNFSLDSLVTLYDRVRYGDKDIEDHEIQSEKLNLDKKK